MFNVAKTVILITRSEKDVASKETFSTALDRFVEAESNGKGSDNVRHNFIHELMQAPTWAFNQKFSNPDELLCYESGGGTKVDWLHPAEIARVQPLPSKRDFVCTAAVKLPTDEEHGSLSKIVSEARYVSDGPKLASGENGVARPEDLGLAESSIQVRNIDGKIEINFESETKKGHVHAHVDFNADTNAVQTLDGKHLENFGKLKDLRESGAVFEKESRFLGIF